MTKRNPTHATQEMAEAMSPPAVEAEGAQQVVGSTLVVETESVRQNPRPQQNQRPQRSLEDEFEHWGTQFEKSKNRIRFLIGPRSLAKIATEEGVAIAKRDRFGRTPQTLEALKTAVQAAWRVIANDFEERSLKEVIEPAMAQFDSLSYDERVAAFKALASLRKRLALNRGHKYEPPTEKESPGLSPALYVAVQQPDYGLSDATLKESVMNFQGTIEVLAEAAKIAASLREEYSGESQGAPIGDILEDEDPEVAEKARRVGKRRCDEGDE